MRTFSASTRLRPIGNKPASRTSRILITICAIFAGLILLGCGQSGPLRLPAEAVDTPDNAKPKPRGKQTQLPEAKTSPTPTNSSGPTE